MSNRRYVMKRLNDLFEEFREQCLKDSDHTNDEIKSRQELQHHFCYLHIIINLGDYACQRRLMDYNKCTLEEDVYSLFHKGGNSTKYKLIHSPHQGYYTKKALKYLEDQICLRLSYMMKPLKQMAKQRLENLEREPKQWQRF